MSKIAQQDVPCPHCGSVARCNFYVSANVTIDPTLKDRILNGSLFKKECSACETHFNVQHDLLYHDMEKELCIWLKYENEFGEIELEAGADRANKVFEGSTLRIVFSRDELIEKIKLAEDGHDDIFIETTKLFYSAMKQIDTAASLNYDRTESKFPREKNLVFIHSPVELKAEEHEIDLLDAQTAFQPLISQIADALKSEWAPWMWVTRATILDAMEECDLLG